MKSRKIILIFITALVLSGGREPEANPVFSAEKVFDGPVPAFSVLPVKITITNSTETFTGKLILSFMRYEENTCLNRIVRPVCLSGSDKGEYRLALPVTAYGKTLIIRCEDDSGETVFERSWDIHFAKHQSVLTAGKVITPLDELGNSESGGPHIVHDSARCSIQNFPRDRLALDGFRILFLHPDADSTISVSQASALEMWVRSGGTAVIAVAENSMLLKEWPFSKHLQVNPDDVRSQVLSQNLLLQNEVGRGRIIFIHSGLFETNKKTAKQQIEQILFNTGFMKYDPDESYTPWYASARTVFRSVQDTDAGNMVSHMFIIFLFLLTYVVAAGPLEFVILKRYSKIEWGWLTSSVVALIVVVCFMAAESRLLGPSRIRTISFLNGWNGELRVVSCVTCRTSEHGSYEIRSNLPLIPFTHSSASCRSQPPVKTGSREHVFRADASALEDMRFVVNGYMPSDRAINLRVSEDRLELKNGLPIPVHDCRFVRGNTIYELGTCTKGLSIDLNKCPWQRFDQSMSATLSKRHWHWGYDSDDIIGGSDEDLYARLKRISFARKISEVVDLCDPVIITTPGLDCSEYIDNGVLIGRITGNLCNIQLENAVSEHRGIIRILPESLE